jgi:mannose-6-phosphate isomerase-like protein (cupin superfamily)
MQTLIHPSGTFEMTTHPFIFPIIAKELSGIPFHTNTEAVTRYVAENFPVHLAIHEVSPVKTPPVTYTQPHIHNDCDEINIIISGQDLLYKILLDDNEYTVNNNSSIWIPRGTMHAANVLQGSGYFITMRIN